MLGLYETAITLWLIQAEDEGMYQCIFNIFPGGSVEGKTSINFGKYWQSQLVPQDHAEP